jgi:hypothetical protein
VEGRIRERRREGADEKRVERVTALPWCSVALAPNAPLSRRGARTAWRWSPCSSSHGLTHTARHVIGCNVPQETRVPKACQCCSGQWAGQIVLATSYDAI